MKLYQGFLIACLVLAFVSPVSSATGGFEWCAIQDINYWNQTSGIGTYYLMDHIPQLASGSSIASPSIVSADGEKTLGQWLTPAFTQQTEIAPGRFIFRSYMSTTSSSGTTTVHYRLFNRSSTGVITWLFFGTAFSKDINSGAIPAEYTTDYARRNQTRLFAGDRLGIQINVSTNSAAARTVIFDLAGNTNASYVRSSYWICNSGSSSNIFGAGDNAVINQSFAQDPTDGKSIPWPLWVISGFVGILLIVLALTRSRTQKMDYEVNIILSVMAWPFCWYWTWGGLTSIDYIVGSGAAANVNVTAMITQHILYSFWVLGWIGVAGSVFAAFVTALLVSQYKLFQDNEAEATASKRQEELLRES